MLLAYNLTASPLALVVGGTIPAATALNPFPALNVTAELAGLSQAQYTSLQAQVTAGQVRFQWSGLPEYNTYSLVVEAPNLELSALPLSFYADGTLGDDNNPGTQALPFKTLSRLLQAVPVGYRNGVLLNMAPGNYAWDASAGSILNNMYGGIDTGAPPVLVGAYSVVAGPFTVTAVNADGSIECTTGLTVDQYFGVPRLTVVSGPGAGVTRMCAGNTTTALLPNAPLTGVAAGSVVQLETPSVFVNMTNAFTLTNSILGAKGIAFVGGNSSGNIALTEYGMMRCEGCIFDFSTVGSITIARCGRLENSTTFAWNILGANNPFSSSRPNGIFFKGRVAQASLINIFNQGALLGQHLFQNCDLVANTECYVSLSGTHSRNSSFTVADLSYLSIGGSSSTARGQLNGNRTGTGWVLGAFDGAVIERCHLLDITNCAGNAIQLGQDAAPTSTTFLGYGGARANIGDVGGSAGNTGVGIALTKNSYAIIDGVSGAANTAVTGTGGDVKGRLTAQTYATVRTADGSGIKGYTDGYLNRIEPPV